MNFFSESEIYYLVDQFHYCLLIGCINISAVLKRQQFKNSESDKIKEIISKRH